MEKFHIPLLFLGVLALAFFARFGFKMGEAPISNNQEKQTSNSTEVKNTSTTDKSINWMNYSNQQHHYSVKYPSTWEVRQGQDFEIIFYDPDLPEPSPAVGWIEVKSDWSIEHEKSEGAIDVEETTFLNLQTTKYRRTTEVGLTIQFLAIKKGVKTYIIGYGLDGARREVFEEMINSFSLN